MGGRARAAAGDDRTAGRWRAAPQRHTKQTCMAASQAALACIAAVQASQRRPHPISPVHRARKFSAVLGTSSARAGGAQRTQLRREVLGPACSIWCLAGPPSSTSNSTLISTIHSPPYRPITTRPAGSQPGLARSTQSHHVAAGCGEQPRALRTPRPGPPHQPHTTTTRSHPPTHRPTRGLAPDLDVEEDLLGDGAVGGGHRAHHSQAPRGRRQAARALLAQRRRAADAAGRVQLLRRGGALRQAGQLAGAGDRAGDLRGVGTRRCRSGQGAAWAAGRASRRGASVCKERHSSQAGVQVRICAAGSAWTAHAWLGGRQRQAGGGGGRDLLAQPPASPAPCTRHSCPDPVPPSPSGRPRRSVPAAGRGTHLAGLHGCVAADGGWRREPGSVRAPRRAMAGSWPVCGSPLASSSTSGPIEAPPRPGTSQTHHQGRGGPASARQGPQPACTGTPCPPPSPSPGRAIGRAAKWARLWRCRSSSKK